jgi:hypothetical protein
MVGEAPARIGDTHPRQQRGRFLARCRTTEAAMPGQDARERGPHGQHRVQAGHRILEDGADVPPAQPVQRGVRRAEQPLAAELSLAGGGQPARQQPQQGEAGEALAAAALTDQRQSLTPPKGEARTFDQGRAAGRADGEVRDREQRRRGAGSQLANSRLPGRMSMNSKLTGFQRIPLRTP